VTRRRVPSRVTPWLAQLTAVVGCAVAMSAGGCGKSGSIVGGACAAGYAQCGNSCVDLSTDPENCGACGHSCAAGVACVAGVCAGSPLTGSGDASVDGTTGVPGGDAGAGTPEATADSPADVGSANDSTTVDAPAADAPGSDSSPSDASSDSSPADASSDSRAADGQVSDSPADGGSSSDGGSGGDDGCAPPFNTPTHCGDCVTSCTGATPICSPTEGGPNVCAAQCDAPYVPCGILCVDPARDPQNCGACGKVCASNLCADSICAGSTPGEDIVIGHDYFGVLPGTAEAQVLANAVMLPAANPLRILSFEEYANPTSVARVKAIIAAAASAQARTVVITVTSTDSDIPDHLTIRNYDLLVVYDQSSASGATLSALGAGWASTLGTYLGVGGAVITLDGASGMGQMPAFLAQSMLLNVASHTPVAWHTPLTVYTPGDSVATGVLSPYGALNDTVEFSADPQSASVAYVVVNPTDNLPVVVHKTVR
jgi:hypothetical protein